MITLAFLRRMTPAALTMAALLACGNDDSLVSPETGSLTVTVSGLPTGVNGTVSIAGPNGFAETVTATTTRGVAAGIYTLTAAPVTIGNLQYIGTVSGSPVSVTAGSTSTVSVVYGAASQPTAILSGSISANRTLSADTLYVIRGFVYVNSGATLTITAGTKLVGDTTALGSTLFILRGARIMASGTAAAPIVFTSQRAPGHRAPGDWGGLVVVGNARSNRTGNIIVEGSDGSVIGANPSGVIYTGGNNDLDNSGVLRYVRVEFGGYATLPDAEVNSFTFAAVGSGTTLEYLQSMAGLDDAFEWFGGTVDGRYLVSYESGDDHFDASEGYRGRNQFLIGYQSTYLTPRAGAGAVSADPQGIEVDGCNGGGCVAPAGGNGQSAGAENGLWTMSMFANFTLVGVGAAQPTPAQGGTGLVLRRGTGGSFFNGVIARWPRQAISLRDSTTQNRLLVDSLMFRNNFLAEIGLQNGGVLFDPVGQHFGQEIAFTSRGQTNAVAPAGTTAASLFVALPTASASTTAAHFNWTPVPAAPITKGGLGDLVNAPRIAARAGTFLIPTTYRGAASPDGPAWWANWTNYARD